MADTFVPPPISSYQGMASEQTVPTGIEGDVIAAARKHGIDEHTFRAAAKNESAFKPDAVSKVGAQGVMQIMPATGRDLGLKDPMDAGQNIEAGAKYWKQLQDKYPGDFAKQAQAYHQGPGAVDRGVPPGPETQKYVARVMKDREAFAGGNGGGPTPAVSFTPPPLSSYQGMAKPEPPPSGYRKAPIPPGLQGPPSGATGGILDAPSESERRMMSTITPGLYAARSYGDPAVADIGSGVEGLQNPNPERKAHAAHQIVSGATRLAAPLAAPAIMAAPGAALLAGATGYGAQQGVDTLASLADVPKGYRELAGDAAALAGAGIPAALRGAGGLAGKVARYGIGKIPYVGKPLVAWADSQIAEKAAVEAAAAKAAKLKEKPTTAAKELKPPTQAEVRAKELSRQSVAKQGQVPTTVPIKDTGIRTSSAPVPHDPEYIPPKPASVASPRDTASMQKTISRQQTNVPEVPARDTGIDPNEVVTQLSPGEKPGDYARALHPEYVPPPPALPSKGTEAIRRPIARQSQPDDMQPAYRETWRDYGEPPSAATGPGPAPPTPPVETVPPEPFKTSARTKYLTRFGGGKGEFDEGAAGLGGRKPYVEKPPPPPPGSTTTKSTATDTTTPTTKPSSTKPVVASKPEADKAARAFKKSVTGKGGGGVETIKSTQPTQAQLGRANRIAAGHNKYLAKVTGGKITSGQVYEMSPAMVDQLEAQIAAAKANELDIPDEPIHFKMGGMIVPDEPRAPQDWSKFKFNRIFSSPSTTHFAQKLSSLTGSPISKRTRQLSADNRTFLNFVKTELGTHDPNESVAWVLPEANANVLAQWVGNGARNNLDLGSKKAHTSAVLRLSKAGGRVTLDNGKGPGIFVIKEETV